MLLLQLQLRLLLQQHLSNFGVLRLLPAAELPLLPLAPLLLLVKFRCGLALQACEADKVTLCCCCCCAAASQATMLVLHRLPCWDTVKDSISEAYSAAALTCRAMCLLLLLHCCCCFKGCTAVGTQSRAVFLLPIEISCRKVSFKTHSALFLSPAEPRVSR
jgi:hypothetical protein